MGFIIEEILINRLTICICEAYGVAYRNSGEWKDLSNISKLEFGTVEELFE